MTEEAYNKFCIWFAVLAVLWFVCGVIKHGCDKKLEQSEEALELMKKRTEINRLLEHGRSTLPPIHLFGNLSLAEIDGQLVFQLEF